MQGGGLKKDKELILKLISFRISFAALSSTVPMFKNGNFALITLQKSSNILLVCDKNHESNSDRENSIKVFRLIKDHKYKNRECDTCKY